MPFDPKPHDLSDPLQDPDDEELEQTPPDVVEELGFDPAEEEEES